MRSTLRLSLLAAVVGSAAVRSVGAQQVVATGRAPAAAVPTAAAPAAIRSIATYRFTGWRGSNLPTEVSIADSAGTIVAGFRTARSGAFRPLAITVRGGDLYLQGMTPAGPMKLEIYEQIAEARNALIGRWTVGSETGELRGHFVPPALAADQR